MPSTRTRAIEPLIAASDPDILEMWARDFGVDLDEMAQAVQAVGTDFEALQEELTGIPALRH